MHNRTHKQLYVNMYVYNYLLNYIGVLKCFLSFKFALFRVGWKILLAQNQIPHQLYTELYCHFKALFKD